jgi:hypothetical protein
MYALTAAIAAVGVVLAAWIAAHQASKDLVVKRQLESTDRFLNLVSILENRTDQGVDVGRNKQIATGWLIAEFGKHNDFLRKTAEQTLEEYVAFYTDDPLHQALVDALAWLRPKRRSSHD